MTWRGSFIIVLCCVGSFITATAFSFFLFRVFNVNPNPSLAYWAGLFGGVGLCLGAWFAANTLDKIDDKKKK